MDALIRTYGERLQFLIKSLIRDPIEAEDLAQETWYSVWRSRGELRRNIVPWRFIRTTAVRKVFDRQREAGRRPFDLEAPVEEPACSHPSSGIEIPFEALGASERSVIVLFYWECLSVREIAELFDVPTGTIKTWLFRARAKLRRRIRAEE
jgi:RNA polymerase sigma-70 factor (ECF subfamily)